MVSNKKRVRSQLSRIFKDIKEVRIQGATNIARAAVKAYSLSPNKKTKKILMSLRPTEPMLSNSLNALDKLGEKKVLVHFKQTQDKINKYVYKIVKKNEIIFTHCHSTNLSKALIYAKKKGRKFNVYSTETRPLFQGRITAKELSDAGIKVTTIVDSASHEAIAKSDIILLGADAILKQGVINKVGSSGIAEMAFVHKKPFYIVADSWKFSPKNVKIEERDFHEIWKHVPRHIKIKNPAFAKIERKYITGIISEYGILKYGDFLRMVGKSG